MHLRYSILKISLHSQKIRMAVEMKDLWSSRIESPLQKKNWLTHI